MKLGINFSNRVNGNCNGTLRALQEAQSIDSVEFQIINISESSISNCCNYDYACFKSGSCVCDDDMLKIIEMIKKSSEILVSIPVYRGHLCSNYYKFHERLFGYYRNNMNNYVDHYLSKAVYFLMVNRKAGLENAMGELMYDIVDHGVEPNVFTISSRDFEESSIDGNLLKNMKFRQYINNLDMS